MKGSRLGLFLFYITCRVYNNHMHIVILGGNSPRHKQWVRDVQSALDGLGDIHVIDYLHWDSGDKMANIKKEVDRLSNEVRGYGQYVIVAKSIGTIIAAIACQRGLITPVGCVFYGLPLSAIQAGDTPLFNGDVSSLPPVTFIQNASDPFGSAKEIDAFVRKNPPLKWSLVYAHGEGHEYVGYEDIRGTVKRYTE